jgi:hypothetical protein
MGFKPNFILNTSVKNMLNIEPELVESEGTASETESESESESLNFDSDSSPDDF